MLAFADAHPFRGRPIAAQSFTLDEALAHAAERIAAGDLNAAYGVLESARTAAPGDPRVLNGLAAILFQAGQRDQAIEHLREAVAIAPAVWTYPRELIRALAATGDDAGTADACAAAVSTHGHQPDLFNYWGLALMRLGEVDAALVRLRAAADADPGNPTYHRNVSLALIKLERWEDSVEAFTRSTAPWPAASTEPDAAVDVAAAYGGLVDAYDDNDLHHAIADTMADVVGDHVTSRDVDRIIDCGCGTGLLGARLAPYSATMVGIDLAPGMLERAARTGHYADLLEGDMIDRMAAITEPADLVVCCNAIYHIADLAPFYGAARSALSADGWLIFSADPCTDAADIRISEPGEYAHGRAYLRRLARAHGFDEVEITVAPHRAYPGFWCVFKKSG
ncbi:MAG: tetratricopeptide repeat protein [Magnetovibrio sp.]|nr:tetratricopeptide repeat protein [Magnetovibrio sp.]